VGKRHQRIRALSATGPIAGAATDKARALSPSSKNRPAKPAFSQKAPVPVARPYTRSSPSQQPSSTIFMPRFVGFSAPEGDGVTRRGVIERPARLMRGSATALRTAPPALTATAGSLTKPLTGVDHGGSFYSLWRGDWLSSSRCRVVRACSKPRPAWRSGRRRSRGRGGGGGRVRVVGRDAGK